MTLYEFNNLSENEKANATWDGTFLMSREDKEFKFLLYCISDFFVEVSYDFMKNEITSFRSFRTKRVLDNYLNEIDIAI